MISSCSFVGWISATSFPAGIGSYTLKVKASDACYDSNEETIALTVTNGMIKVQLYPPTCTLFSLRNLIICAIIHFLFSGKNSGTFKQNTATCIRQYSCYSGIKNHT